MAANKTTTQSQRDAQKAEIAKYHARGYTQYQIAEKLGVTQQSVSYWLKKIDQEAANLLEDRVSRKRARLVELDELRREAWDAWERSKEPAVVEVEESGIGVNGPTSKDQKRTEHQVGDAAYLNQVQRAIEQERAMLGFDAPTRTEIDATVTQKGYTTKDASPDAWDDSDDTTAR